MENGAAYKENNNPSCRYVYVQFQSMKGKDKFVKAMDINPCKRMVMRCKKQHDAIAHKYIGGRWPVVQEAPDPTLIIWKNLGNGKIKRCGLSTMSNILALILLLVGFLTIVYLLALQADVKLDIETCGEVEIDETLAFDNWLKFRQYDDAINTCFCLQKFKTE